MSRGKVYIASMNMRGVRAQAPEGVKKVNVTSAQSKTSQYRLDFSPMTETGYKGYFCFENYWQSGKVFEGLDREKQLEWWKKQTKGKRKYPPGKDVKVLYGEFEGKTYGYLDSREWVYVPEYYALMKETKSFKELKSYVEEGNDVVIYDFDGPRNDDGSVSIELVEDWLLVNKFNDPRFPFGHGYIVAASLAGFEPDDYAQVVLVNEN